MDHPPRKRLRAAGCPRLAYPTLRHDPRDFADLLERHGYVILTQLPRRVTSACAEATRALQGFFETDAGRKKQFVCSDSRKRCGYRVTSRSEGVSDECLRESYQVRVDAGTLQPWPSMLPAAAALRCGEELEAVARECLQAALRGAPLPARKELRELRLGPSVLDAFHYLPTQLASEGTQVLMFEHLDPGFLTLEPRASASGLQVLDRETSEWRFVEPDLGEADLLVFACEALERVTKGAIKGSLHRVASPSASSPDRLALAYELRSLEPRFEDFSSPLVSSRG